MTEHLPGRYVTAVAKKYRLFLREIILSLARAVGSEIIDAHTGERLGRALVICWSGRVRVVGLERAVYPLFLPQKRLTYWRQELGFAPHPEPDFPHEAHP